MRNKNNVDIPKTLENLARGYRIVAANGHLEATLGHLSWRDPEGRGLWMKCQEIGLDEVEVGDLHLIDWEGKVLDGSNGHRHSEWPHQGSEPHQGLDPALQALPSQQVRDSAVLERDSR